MIKKPVNISSLDIERLQGQRAISDIADPKTGEVFVKAGRRITRAVVKRYLQLVLRK